MEGRPHVFALNIREGSGCFVKEWVLQETWCPAMRLATVSICNAALFGGVPFPRLSRQWGTSQGFCRLHVLLLSRAAEHLKGILDVM